MDATAIPADRGGVGRYLDSVLPAIADLGVDLVVACQQRDAETTSALLPRAEVVPVRPMVARRSARVAWEQVGLPRLVRRARAQVLHSPHYTMPLRCSVPVVVTLHDATFFSHPEVHTALKRRFFRAWTRLAARSAAALVVPSHATAREVVRFVGADPARFYVAHHGVDPGIFHPASEAEVARVRHTLGLDGRYVAFLGTLEPRKNVRALVRAWVSVSAADPAPAALVLAGAPGWDDELEAVVRSVPAHLRLLRTGYLPLGDLAGYLAGAEVVAYPSLGEGFGLPVLEAMACGATVLTTRELALPEVGGDAVAYCGIEDADIAAVLRDLLLDPDRRAALGDAARARSAGFTWEAAARVHVAAYERAAGAGCERRPNE